MGAAGTLLVLGALTLSAPAQAARPNVLVLLTDDQGWGDLSLHGNTNLRTPHLDALARAGASFERFFVQPVCSPTRAELLTGRWHPRGGVRGVSTGGERLDLDERTLADSFRAAGYATACFGKWHNGSQYPYHPLGRGFADYYGFTSGHWGDYFAAPLDHNGQPVQGKGYLTDDLTDRAIAFVRTSAAARRPFFCYVAYNVPHSPMQVPDRTWSRFEKARLALRGGPKEDVAHSRAALAMTEHLDDSVGRLLAALKGQGLDRDTIVVYFNDNGPNGPRWNGGMKGHKGSTDEGGVRSPLHVRWPAKVPAGRVVTPIAGAVDLLPTLLALTGVERVGSKPLDGISLAPWLLGDGGQAPDRVLFAHWAGRVSARDQRFRLDPKGQLFDLTTDPGQQHDVAADQPEAARRLGAAVTRWRREVLGELPPNDERPFPVGHVELPRTVLPARDGVPHGGVKRSAPAPNCSFFTGWTTAADRMTWPVEVKTAGRYEAIVHYTCPKGDTGSALELTLGPARWTGTVAEAHDPPLRGGENDRVPRRGESYVKTFRPLSLGSVALPAGSGTLTLRATQVPGKQVADVRAVELILQAAPRDATPPAKRSTAVAIRGAKFLVNGEPTYKGRTWNGQPIEGLLFNSRMVQATFDDRNPKTVGRWAYPDTGKWDAERNTREFLAQMPEWRRHGLLAVTLNLQGGSPQGYSKDQPWHNSALNADGSLDPRYLARFRRILDRADELGMVVILGVFYFGQDERLKDEAAVRAAVDAVVDWLMRDHYTNVLLEINNECDVRYDHALLRPDRVHELIGRARAHAAARGFPLLVGTSYGGGTVPRPNVVKASDFLLLHGNGVSDPGRIAEMVRRTRQVEGYRPMPVLFNEDDHFDFDRPRNHCTAAVAEYASWGYFDYRMKGEGFDEGYQSVPVNWRTSSARKKGFFQLLSRITGERP